MNGIEGRVVGVLECLDEAGNVLLGTDERIPLAGNPHATISQRIGQMLTLGTPEQQELAREADAILTRIQVEIFGFPVEKSHCLDAIKDFPNSLPSAG